MKKLIICLLVVSTVTLSMAISKPAFAATTAAHFTDQESLEDQYLVRFIEAIKNRDNDLACELWAGEGNESTINLFTTLYDFWDGRELTSYKKTNEKRRPEDETQKRPAGTMYEYEIISGNEIFNISFSITDNYNGGRYIDSFNFTLKIDNANQSTIPNWVSIVRWVMLFLSVTEIGYTLYVAVICIKDKPRFWGLWVAFILVAYGGISLSLVDSIKTGLFFHTLRTPYMRFYPGLGAEFYLSVPIGAIVYCKKRTTLKKQME